MSEATWQSLPFDEAIKFFRDKTSVPADRLCDLARENYARSFIISGLADQSLLDDIRAAVDKGISQGTTLAEFQKDFDSIIAGRGWLEDKPSGYTNWRAAAIFNENVSMAYRQGRYQQMTSPAVLAVRPYWRYLPSSSENPRPEHEAFYNVVLPADDPWWEDHYAPIPGDFGCKCGVQALTEDEVREIEGELAGSDFPMQREVPRTEPDLEEAPPPAPELAPDLAPPGPERMTELDAGWQSSDEAEKKMIEDLSPDELNKLISEQRSMEEAKRPAPPPLADIDPDLPSGKVQFGWVSENGQRAYENRAMVPEMIAKNYFGADAKALDDLWTQAGREWHHVRERGATDINRERYFRLEDLMSWADKNNPAYKDIYFKQHPKSRGWRAGK